MLTPCQRNLLRTVPRTAQKWPVAVAPNLGFTSERSHPVPSLRWGCGNTIKSCRSWFLLRTPVRSLRWVPSLRWCHPWHDYGIIVVMVMSKGCLTIISVFVYGSLLFQHRIPRGRATAPLPPHMAAYGAPGKRTGDTPPNSASGGHGKLVSRVWQIIK